MRNLTINLIKAFSLSFLISLTVALILGGTVYKRNLDFKIDESKISIDPMHTIIYDKYGNIMAEFEGEGKNMTPYEEIPEEIIQAVISVEDREFFEHPGLNVKAIFRAVLVNLRSGDFSQGGSTITQQLVKEIYLNPGKTLERKQREAIISTILEERFSKKDIISYYINHNFYGHRAYGIKNAVHTYFGQTLEEFKKEDPEVRVAKAAFLAGVPNAPSYFDPYENYSPTMQRRNTVLTSMYIEGYINGEIYNKAKELDFLVLEKPDTTPKGEVVHYPEFVYYTLEEASKGLGKALEEVMYSGLKIHTSFDPYMYKILRDKMSNGNLYPQNPSATEKIQGATVFLDPRNGEIFAMTGSRDETNEFLVLNRAFQSKRQPGSSMKPLISYGPALETGNYNQFSSIVCQSSFGDYYINDYGCWGSQSMQEALRVSSNSTAVWLLNQIGIDYARDYVEKLGIKLSDNDIYLPIALGGLEEGVTTLEMADAFQVFANEGKRTPAHTIRSIRNNDNEILYQPEESKQLISEDSARQMYEMLRGAVSGGTGTSAYIDGANIAGKTGTNQMASGGGNMDLWFVGFNQSVVGSVWMGYDNTDTVNYIRSGQTSQIPARMFREIIVGILSELNKDRNSELKKKLNDDLELNAYMNTLGNQIKLTWEAEKNTKYEIYRNETLIGETYNGEYLDNLLAESTEYKYQILGYNAGTGKKTIESKFSIIETP